MVLTGKCKKDFVKSKLGDNEGLFETMLPIYQNALIVEFFDSVGIYIDVKKSHSVYWIYDITIEDSRLPISALIPMQESRQEATIEAIKKANDVYNERFKQDEKTTQNKTKKAQRKQS